MKVLVVSDTHRFNDNFYKAVENEKPFDMVIHCGDAEGTEYALSANLDVPFEIVCGNCDFFSVLPREIEVDLCGHKVFVTHGHAYNVSVGYERLADEAESRGCEMVLCGHTHVPYQETIQDTRVMNPGSLTYPRQHDRRPSYGLIYAEENTPLKTEIKFL